MTSTHPSVPLVSWGPPQPWTPSISAKGSTSGQPITRFAKTDLDRVPPRSTRDLEWSWSGGELSFWDVFMFFFGWKWLESFLPRLLLDWIFFETSLQDISGPCFVLIKMLPGSNIDVYFASVTLVSSSFQTKSAVYSGIIPLEWTGIIIKWIFKKKDKWMIIRIVTHLIGRLESMFWNQFSEPP